MITIQRAVVFVLCTVTVKEKSSVIIQKLCFNSVSSIDI
jgi:hypothetical protein